jgi:hypothetical protein
MVGTLPRRVQHAAGILGCAEADDFQSPPPLASATHYMID